jgi:hypothetical protein
MSQEATVKPYVTKSVNGLLYAQKPALIESIVERRPDRYFPKGARSGYTAGQTIELEITGDQFVDGQTGSLAFDLVTTHVDDKISNSLDVIKKISIFYNDQEVEAFDDANTWANAFLIQSGTRDWFKTEGSALMGISNQATGSTNAEGTRESSAYKNYVNPLPLVSGFFRIPYYLPLVGNRLRIVIVLAPNVDVLSMCNADTDTYTLNNVSLQMDTIIVQQAYRDRIIEAMKSDEGFRIPYNSYRSNQLSCTASTRQDLVLNHNLSNALSLHMLRDATASKVMTATKWNLGRQSYHLNTFAGLNVRCGSRWFTPPDDIKTFAELYRMAELTLNNFLNLNSSGFVDSKLLTAAYIQAAVIDNGSYGICPLSVNLETAVENDDATLNNGINSQDGMNEFNITLKTSAALAATDKLLCNIVHRRCLTFARSGIAVEF